MTVFTAGFSISLRSGRNDDIVVGAKEKQIHKSVVKGICGLIRDTQRIALLRLVASGGRCSASLCVGSAYSGDL